ncbi:MAG: deoxyguanosinetriphosphate triphosphohydrolase [Deinococcota bacterium]
MLVERSVLEQREQTTLAPYAVLAGKSRGRIYPEDESRYRTAFQKDRDRVVHSNAFRRLEYKTQVFVNNQGDHYRTRLTHTLEVAQVAKSITRALGLNEDLAETIALAHDLGHPPFGHAGEATLDRLAKHYGDEAGFDHNKQSLRIVTKLEQRYRDFPGLNLSWEVLEGIMKHETRTSLDDALLDARWEPNKHPSLEAQLVDLADELAYNVHDLDDGLRSGHLAGEQLTEVTLVAEMLEALDLDPRYLGDVPTSKHNVHNADANRYWFIRELLGKLIEDTVVHTHMRLTQADVQSLADIRTAGRLLAGPSAEVQAQLAELKDFLYSNLYFHYRQLRMTNKVERLLEQLFHAYADTPKMLPLSVQQVAEDKGTIRAITDYLAGMTDRYASNEYKRLFDPQVLT